MVRVNNLVLEPTGTCRTRSVALNGRTYLSKKEAKGILAEEGAVAINPRPVHFRSLHDFMSSPDPEHLVPKPVSPFAAVFLGASPRIVISSDGNPWPQQRVAGSREYDTLYDQWKAMAADAFITNAVAPAARQDAGSLPALGMWASTIVILVAVILFAGVIIQERLMG